MIPSIILALIVVSPLSQIVGASQQSALYRDQQLSFANFKQYREKRLTAEKIKSVFVTDVERNCSFLCVNEPRCFSFNIATYTGSRGLHLCELLATDKYRAKIALQTNSSFRHYSPIVSRSQFLLYLFWLLCSCFQTRATILFLSDDIRTRLFCFVMDLKLICFNRYLKADADTFVLCARSTMQTPSCIRINLTAFIHPAPLS